MTAEMFCPNCGEIVHSSARCLVSPDTYKDCTACGWTGHKTQAHTNRLEAYRPVVTPERLLQRAIRFTNAGSWQASWHWERGEYGRATAETLRDALKSLGCADEEAEIQASRAEIRLRYAVAEDIREYMTRDVACNDKALRESAQCPGNCEKCDRVAEEAE